MNTVEVIDEKINLLKNAIKELDLNTSDEKEKIEKEITIIEDCQEIFNDENLLCKYDFTEAINLLNKYDFTITNLLKILTDIQTAITIKHELDLDDLPLSSNQDITLKTFLDSLSKIKNNLQEKIEELRKNNDSRITVSNLELLKRILEEKGRRKYYTYDMLEAFYEVIDWDTLSPFE